MTDAERTPQVTPPSGDAVASEGATRKDAVHSPEESVSTADVSSSGQESAEASKEPKLVKRVVCSYQLGWLPGEWLQTWRRLDRVFARANLRVKATLAPLEDLPEDTDIVVVPPELRDAAKAAAPEGTPILVTPASAAAGAFAELVARLQAGTEFAAETLDPEEEKTKPRIVSYRGHTIID